MKKYDLKQFNRERADEYRSRINELYEGKMHLIDTDEYRGTRFKIKHHCDVCGSDFMARSSDMLMGVGCPHCKTSAVKIAEVSQYEKSICRTHEGRHTLLMRGSLAGFEIGKTYVHYCRDCDTTFKARPKDVLSSDFVCPLCTQVRALRTTWYDYAGRMNHLYGTGYRLRCASKIHGPSLMVKHRCDICKLVWKDNVVNMLTGASSVGCEHVSHSVINTLVVEFNRNTYVLRNEAESKALHKVLVKIPHCDLRTALTYPIPLIPSARGSHVPSFMDRHTGMLVDVFTLRAFNRNYSKWKAVAETALWAGLDYRVIIVDGRKVSLLPKVWVHV